MVKTLFELKQILALAKHDALLSIQGPDGGPCNFDYVIVNGQSVLFLKACEEVGLKAEKEIGRRIIRISNPDCSWQGWNNTHQAEAINKRLQLNGIESYVNYVID
jgi:hypothetical protein